jgi:peroxiredoxin
LIKSSLGEEPRRDVPRNAVVSTVAPLPAVELADRLDRSQQQPPWHVVLLDTKVMEIRTMKLVNVAIATVCAALLSLTICPAPAQVAGSQAAPTHVTGTPDVLAPQEKRKEAPDFTLTDANGRTVTLSAYKGKVVLLDFWATWCGGCKVEIPWYVEFDHKYRDKGLAVIGVSMDNEGMKIVKPFLAQKKIEYPVVIGNDGLAKQYDLTSMPMTLLIGRDGKVAISHAGIVDKDNFEGHIQTLLR